MIGGEGQGRDGGRKNFSGVGVGGGIGASL